MKRARSPGQQALRDDPHDVLGLLDRDAVDRDDRVAAEPDVDAPEDRVAVAPVQAGLGAGAPGIDDVDQGAAAARVAEGAARSTASGSRS